MARAREGTQGAEIRALPREGEGASGDGLGADEDKGRGEDQCCHRPRPGPLSDFLLLSSPGHAQSSQTRAVLLPPPRSLPPTFPSCHSFGSILASAALTMRLSSSLALGLLLSGTLAQAAKIPFTQRKRPNHSLQKRSGKTSFRRPVLAAASSNSDSDGDLDLRYSPPSHPWTTPTYSFAIAHFTTCCILLT